MVSVRRRRKEKTSLPRQTRKLKSKQKKVRIKSNAIIASNWDEKLTLSQNYKKLGLTAKLSRPSGGVEKEILPVSALNGKSSTVISKHLTLASDAVAPSAAVTEARIIRDEQTNEVIRIEQIIRTEFDEIEVPKASEAVTDVVKQLEEFASRGERTTPRIASEREKEWIKALIERHGDDYEAMFRDRKLNIWQQSVGDIRKRVKKFLSKK
ncbi:ribosome biogenesis protein Nop16 [Dipodascopsis uninucleata]